MTVPQETVKAADATFGALNTRDLDVLIAKITAGWRTAAAAHPLCCPLWEDARELLEDLHAAWFAAFYRENPGRAVPGAGT